MKTHDGQKVIVLRPVCTNEVLYFDSIKLQHHCLKCGYWQWADKDSTHVCINVAHRIEP